MQEKIPEREEEEPGTIVRDNGRTTIKEEKPRDRNPFEKPDPPPGYGGWPGGPARKPGM